MNTHDIELPPLPELKGGWTEYWTKYAHEKMRDYARTAIEADRLRGTAKQRYDSVMEGSTEADPIERLRFYCSLAMSGQDWIDVEPFFDALIADHATLRNQIKRAEEPKPQAVPKCCVCGTTENLHEDGWYGYRCNSVDCICY